MIKTKFEYPKSYSQLDQYKRNQVDAVLKRLEGDQNFEGVFWGGSTSYKELAKDILGADIDLFCLTKDVDLAGRTIKGDWTDMKELDIVLDQGTFPWTGKLYTLYFKGDLDFTIDVCLVKESTADKFMWEPQGKIIFDRAGKIAGFLATQKANPNFTHLPSLKAFPFSQAVVSLKKVKKNVARGHLWNALYVMTLMRNYIMQIIRLHDLRDTNFLGRVDRDIEEVLPHEVNGLLVETVAAYDAADIARKTLKLCDILESKIQYVSDTNETDIKEWILRQVKHEREKLQDLVGAR